MGSADDRETRVTGSRGSSYRGRVPAPSFDEMLDLVGPVAEWFVDAGHRVYAVGGIVRDRLLELPLGPDTDIDLTTDATPSQTKALVADRVEAMWTQGERYGTIGIQYRGRIFEITTHRSEVYTAETRKPTVDFAGTIDADLARRDFTVNAMAMSLPDGALVDPFGGCDDLEARRLRTPLTAEESFADDPLRMLRAARFVATFDLTADQAIVAALASMASRLEIVAVERIMIELTRLLALPDPRSGLVLAADGGLLGEVIPEADVYAPNVLDVIGATPPDHRVRLAVLLAACTPAQVKLRLGALRLSVADRRSILRLVELARSGPPTEAAEIRRFVSAAGDDLEAAIALLDALGDQAGSVAEAVARLAASEDLTDLRGSLDGEAVMALLGISPGAEVGEALDYVASLRLDEGLVDRAETERRLLRWWSERRD